MLLIHNGQLLWSPMAGPVVEQTKTEDDRWSSFWRCLCPNEIQQRSQSSTPAKIQKDPHHTMVRPWYLWKTWRPARRSSWERNSLVSWFSVRASARGERIIAYINNFCQKLTKRYMVYDVIRENHPGPRRFSPCGCCIRISCFIAKVPINR